MAYFFINTRHLQRLIGSHMEGKHIYNLPEGRHEQIINNFYKIQGKPDLDAFGTKLEYVNGNLSLFDSFLATQDQYKTSRLNGERQARLEPERTKVAIEVLTQMGFEVQTTSSNEINFIFKGATIKYFPYTQWATGRTIKDGRGLNHLIDQLK